MQQAVSEDERKIYDQLIESIGWFFFDLFILGYVEDPATGHSFRFPGGVKISIYVEVSTVYINLLNKWLNFQAFFN